MDPSPGDTSPSNHEIRKESLYEFIRHVDESFQVSVSRLSGLPSKVKVNFGGLLIGNAIKVFWNSRQPVTSATVGSEFDTHLLQWVTTLVDVILSEVLCVSSDESTALRQVLMMGLPPHSDSMPVFPTTESFVTQLSSIRSVPEDERDRVVEFLERYPCVAPLPLVIWLRDCVVLLILQSSGENRLYDARTREVLFSTAESFSLDSDAVRMWERSIGEILHGTDSVMSSQATVSRNTKMNQRIKIGLGAVGGAVILGVTGGLALPVLASVVSGVGAAFTGIGLGVIGTVFATTSMVLGSISVAGAVALFGITGGSLMTYKLSHRFGDLKEEDFKFRRIVKQSDEAKSNDALEVVLCISGYLRNSRDYTDPWKVIRKRNGNLTDTYALQWEKKNLAELGNVFVKLLSTELATALANVYIQASLGAVATTVALPISVLSVMADSDNILIVCENRAKQAGEALAEIVSNKQLGTRPYTLISYSLGSSAVFSCLERLSNQGYYGCIQNVILLGSTIPCTFLYEGQRASWQKARSVVSGRFINVYSKKDMLLHFLCRYLQWTIQVAGVTEVKEPGIENFDVSDIITSHSDYPAKIGDVLDRVGYFH